MLEMKRATLELFYQACRNCLNIKHIFWEGYFYKSDISEDVLNTNLNKYIYIGLVRPLIFQRRIIILVQNPFYYITIKFLRPFQLLVI